LLSIFVTVTVANPLWIASTENQTLLLTVLSPHDKGGSEPTVVAPTVVEAMVLLAHKLIALAQLLFCADAANEIEMQISNEIIPFIIRVKIIHLK